MLIRYLVSMAGPGIDRRVGDDADVDAAEAGRLIAAGYAVAVDPAPPQEVSTRTRPARERRG